MAKWDYILPPLKQPFGAERRALKQVSGESLCELFDAEFESGIIVIIRMAYALLRKH